jgi:RNA polymerase-binding transcription factor
MSKTKSDPIAMSAKSQTATRASTMAAAKKSSAKKLTSPKAAKTETARKKAPAKIAATPPTAAKKLPTTSRNAAKKPAKSTPSKPAAKKASKSKVKPSAKTVRKAIDKPVKSITKEKPLSVGGKKSKAADIVLDSDYRPSENEPFMNERQRAYFRNKLKAWKEEIIRQTRETLAGLHEDSTQHADLADRATSETDRALELRARDRQRKLIAKIDAALARIEDGSYGFCEETGEPIGLKRLDARPIATLSLEAQERHERRERVYRED